MRHSKFRVSKVLWLVPVLLLLLATVCFAMEPAKATQNGKLILVTGVDGTVGYVYESDLQSAKVKADDDLLDHLQSLKDTAASDSQNPAYAALIPLYAEDGKTVIGQYGLGYMAGDYDAELYRVDAGLLESKHPIQAYHDAQGNVHLVEMDIAKIEPHLTAEGNEYYAYMQIETAEPELIPVILEARRRIIYQDGAGWVEDHIDGCIRDSDGVVIEILPHFHEVFPSDWEIPWYPPEYNPKGSAYNP